MPPTDSDCLSDYLVDGFERNGYVYADMAATDQPPCPRCEDVRVVTSDGRTCQCTRCGLRYTAAPLPPGDTDA
jgi:hypothetical protein